tara:strand:+ start:162 stop:614 length:453 start_codon:yes stop_codon:yes gene_type:complete
MKIISHRGNLKGPDPKNENTQRHIDIALKGSFDVEIDLWKINDKFFLGHDEPLNEVSLEWLESRKKNLWIHTKNFLAFEDLMETNNNYNFFFYTREPLVLVSNGKIWCHKPFLISNPKNCIIPILHDKFPKRNKYYKWYGVCTDFPQKLL